MHISFMTLDEYLIETDQGGSEFSRKLGVPPQYVSKWRNALVLPSHRQVLAIEVATGGRVMLADFVRAYDARKAA